MGKNEEFDWLDDPFDEKKAAREQVRASTSGGTKMALGCGCLPWRASWCCWYSQASA